MLYKKYHRNYVKQFKKGAKFNIISVEAVQEEPWYDSGIIFVTGSKFGCWYLVSLDGRIDKCRCVI